MDTSKTISAFAEITGKSVDEITTLAKDPIFQYYEKGEITSTDFRDGLRKLFQKSIDDSAIDTAWNAMIGDTPIHRLHWLKALNEKYRVFILSNTNVIHVDYFHGYLHQHHSVNDFSNHVEEVYYSQQIGMRKPNKEIFDFVLQQNELEASRTLFLDDNSINLEGAAKCGIEVALVNHPERVPELLTNEGIEL